VDSQLLERVLEVRPNGVRRHEQERRDLLVRQAASDPTKDLGLAIRERVPIRLVDEVGVKAIAKRDQERPQELEQVSIALAEITVGPPPADVEVPRDAGRRRKPETNLVFDPQRTKGVVLVVQPVELASREEVGDLERARVGAPPHHAQGVLAAERAHGVDDLGRGIGEGQLATREQAMADDLPLVVADDLARNQPHEALDHALSELIGIFGRMRVVDQGQRFPHV
jgi:hypothetical protein